MIYTAYSDEQYQNTPKKYCKEVLGISYQGNILQIPLCPECGNEMMEDGEYLSCITCGNICRKRIVKNEEFGNE